MYEPIYLDHNATTPLDKRVLEKMLPFFCDVFGNPASIDHLHGHKAKQAVDEARQTIAKLLGCRHPGTLNVPGIVGMTEALSLAIREMRDDNIRLKEAADLICKQLQQAFPGIKLNGHPQSRLTHNLSLTIPGVEAKALIHLLKNKLSFSAGSACSTVKVEPSHVLKSIGLSDDETFHTIRLGLGRATLHAHSIADILIGGIQQLKG